MDFTRLKGGRYALSNLTDADDLVDPVLAPMIRRANLIRRTPHCVDLWECLRDGATICYATDEQLAKYNPALLAQERRFRQRLVFLGLVVATLAGLILWSIALSSCSSPVDAGQLDDRAMLPSGVEIVHLEALDLRLSDGQLVFTGGQPIDIWIRESDARLWGLR